MIQKTFLISDRDYSLVRNHDCWPRECMGAHGAEGRNTTYIGSRIENRGLIWDYWVDTSGAYWYSHRWREPNGKIISMEEHLFSNKYKKRSRN